MSLIRPGARERQPADDFERRYGCFGGRELRAFGLTSTEARDSGKGDGQFTLVGHAAVFDMWSLDLGFFREKIARGAFDAVLSRNPDVWHLWDHDPRYVLARTTNKTLELSVDPRGLRFWSRIAPTSYAADLRVLVERGDVDQASFAFTVARDEWLIEEDAAGNEQISRTILEVAELYDVTTTAMGAYPQTDTQLARSKVLTHLRTIGQLPEELAHLVAAAETDPLGGSDVAPAETDPVGGRNQAARLVALRARGRRARLKHNL